MGNGQTLTCRIPKDQGLSSEVEEIGKQNGFIIDTNFSGFSKRDVEKYDHIVFSLSLWYYYASLKLSPQERFELLQKQIEDQLRTRCTNLRFKLTGFKICR